MLTRQISSKRVDCVGFRWPKTTTFGQILTFGGLLYWPPFTDEGQIWRARADPWSTLTCQISSCLVYSVAHWWWKTPNFTILLTLAFCGVTNWRHIKTVSILQQLHAEIVCRNSVVQKTDAHTDNRQTKNSSSCNNAPLLIQDKFGMDSTHMVYADTPNFIWMCSLCRLLVAKTTTLGKFWHLGYSCTDPLLPMRAKCGMLEQTHGLCLNAKFHLDRHILSPSGGENPKFYHFIDFGILWRHQLASYKESWTRVHNCKPSPIQQYQNRFYTTTVSWQNRMQKLRGSKEWWTHRQTDKLKTLRFWPPWRRVKSEPHHTWHSDKRTSSTFFHL